MKNKFIYVDLNSLIDNKINMGQKGRQDVLEKYGHITSGMEVLLWTDDLNDQNKYDPMVYEGKVVSGLDDIGCIFEILPENIEHYSNSKKYSHYSLEEIMGESYLKEKESHPEWF